MNTFRTRHDHRVLSRAHRHDPRRESRCSLALIMLMGLATLSVLATTQAVSSAPSQVPALHWHR